MSFNKWLHSLWIVPVFILMLAGMCHLLGWPVVNVASPYDAAESLNWIRKTVAGLEHDNPAAVRGLPVGSELNGKVKAEYTVTFTGDIMPLSGRDIVISDGVRDFINGSDYLVGNFEGTIAGEKPVLPLITSDLYHTEKIIKVLSDLFPPERTYLSVANNHAGDLGQEKFFDSVAKMRSKGFNVFGWKERPFIDIGEDIRLTSGTMWSNRKNRYVFMLGSAEKYIKPGVFNVLYPHFGYELELYPRPGIVSAGKGFLKKFDAVIGHHSHCPQPVTAELVAGQNKLIAYSLGDLLGDLTTKKYQYGIILKVVIGRNENGEWMAGRQQWILSRCAPGPDGKYVLKECNEKIWVKK